MIFGPMEVDNMVFGAFLCAELLLRNTGVSPHKVGPLLVINGVITPVTHL